MTGTIPVFSLVTTHSYCAMTIGSLFWTLDIDSQLVFHRRNSPAGLSVHVGVTREKDKDVVR